MPRALPEWADVADDSAAGDAHPRDRHPPERAPTPMTPAPDAYHQLLIRLGDLAHAVGRPAPLLLAVSKTRTPEEIRAVAAAGCRDFGENYLQEALDKQTALRDLPLVWHFIGPLQSNKTRAIAAHFDWVHSLDREKIAQRLNDQRPAHLPPLQVCLQVNIDAEASKAGVLPDELPGLAEAVSRLPRLRLRGLMCIPEPRETTQDRHMPFAKLRYCMENLNTHGFRLDTLSMGMSDDLEAAIGEGSTIVRIGTALFGARPPKH